MWCTRESSNTIAAKSIILIPRVPEWLCDTAKIKKRQKCPAFRFFQVVPGATHACDQLAPFLQTAYTRTLSEVAKMLEWKCKLGALNMSR
jgi:hypothetical protein